MKKSIILSLVSAMTFILAGCSSTSMTKRMYEGDELSAEKVAVIKVTKPKSSWTCGICSVNDQKVPKVMGLSYPTEVHLLPGNYDIKFVVKVSGYTVNTSFYTTFSPTVQAGGTYTLKSLPYEPVSKSGKISKALFGDSDDSVIKFWLESNSGKIIDTVYYYDHDFRKDPPSAEKYKLKQS